MQLKEQVGGDSDLTVLSIGPDRVKEAIKKALAMGGDRGVHVRDDAYYQKDCFEIASIIAEFARDKGFDAVFTGMQSQDRGSGQVGVLVAETLGIPAVTTIVDFAFEGGIITAKRELEGGVRAVVKVKTPALVSCQLGLNTPRYPTLPNIMKAKKKELQTLEVADLLKVEELVSVEKMFVPEKKKGGLVLEGEVNDLADQLIRIFKEKTSVFK